MPCSCPVNGVARFGGRMLHAEVDTERVPRIALSQSCM
jgi:hypothetical protein